jgi:hypothetical protein
MSRPEDRYVKLETRKLGNGKVVYRSARPRTIEVDENESLMITANERDRMDIIANNVFGSASEWWRIAAANRRVDGSLHLPVGTKIVIPKG